MKVYAQFRCVVDESDSDYNGILFLIPKFADVCRFVGIVSLSMQLLQKRKKEQNDKKILVIEKWKEKNGHVFRTVSGSQKKMDMQVYRKNILLTITTILVPYSILSTGWYITSIWRLIDMFNGCFVGRLWWCTNTFHVVCDWAAHDGIC